MADFGLKTVRMAADGTAVDIGATPRTGSVVVFSPHGAALAQLRGQRAWMADQLDRLGASHPQLTFAYHPRPKG